MEVLKTALPYIISGISVGGQYALIAIGNTMVYGILRLINFAHGDVFMVAGLMMVYFSTWMPLYLAIPLMIALTVLLGFFDRAGGVQAPAYRAPHVGNDLRHRRQLSDPESGVVCDRRSE